MHIHNKKYFFLIFIIFITIAATLILLILYRNSLDSNYIYISTIANVIVIFLMLLTIIITENSTRQQIDAWDNWNNIQRKQFLKALIKELKFNVTIYQKMLEKAEKEVSLPQLNNFIFVNIEKSLQNTPTDVEIINDNLLNLYYNMKIHENKIKITRIPGIPEKTIKFYIKSIATDYESMKISMDTTIMLLEEYEKGTKIEIMEKEKIK